MQDIPTGAAAMTTAPKELHRVVIVGAGFGGLETAFGLAGAPVKITLVDRRNHHLFQPLLYQVATASLATSEIAWPIRYLSLRLEDDTFIHFVETAADDGSSALPKLAAFGAFQSGIRDRCVEPPLPRGATVVGNYRMLSEA